MFTKTHANLYTNMHLYTLIVLSYNLTSTQAFFTPLHAKKDTFFVSVQIHNCRISWLHVHRLLNWVDFSDSVEVLWGAENSFDVTIYLPDLSGSTLASATFRFYLKHHQTSNLGPGLWKLDLIYCLSLSPPSSTLTVPPELGNVTHG